MSLAACSELVNDLEALGYLERLPDPADGRAKLIVPTERGRQLLKGAAAAVESLENRCRALCPPGAYDQALETMDHLLRQLEGQNNI